MLDNINKKSLISLIIKDREFQAVTFFHISPHKTLMQMKIAWFLVLMKPPQINETNDARQWQGVLIGDVFQACLLVQRGQDPSTCLLHKEQRVKPHGNNYLSSGVGLDLVTKVRITATIIFELPVGEGPPVFVHSCQAFTSPIQFRHHSRYPDSNHVQKQKHHSSFVAPHHFLELSQVLSSGCLVGAQKPPHTGMLKMPFCQAMHKKHSLCPGVAVELLLAMKKNCCSTISHSLDVSCLSV